MVKTKFETIQEREDHFNSRKIERDEAIEIAFRELKGRESIYSVKENLLQIIQEAIDTIILWSDTKNEYDLIQNSLYELSSLRDLINNKETLWQWRD